MIPQRCPGCGDLVLSLMGQIERLDSYLLGPGGPPPESAGTWHTACLLGSSVGGVWAAARIRNFVEVRGHAIIARVNAWSVLVDPRDGERMAISDRGTLLVLPPLSKLTPVGGWTGYREHKRTYNLHLPSPDLIAAMQAALVERGTCSMSIMFDRLGLWSRLHHAEGLADARFAYDEELRDGWTVDSLSAAAEYNVHVPPELLTYCS